ncbi:MAG: EAL domain-containing protein [Clostridia bacterium]|nr:EAL domain-containing protein [Clostridia bacterium]
MAEEVISNIIAETLSSGIEPLHRKYHGIYDGYGDIPTALFTETEVFTSATGVITGYKGSIDKSEIGRRFSLSSIANAIRVLNELEKHDVRVSFVTAEITSSFLSGDVAKDLGELLNESVKPESVCLVIDEERLKDGGEKVAEGVAEARGMGFPVAVNGFDGEQSLSSLMKVTVDYAFLSPDMTARLKDRNKEGLFTALTGLLRSLRVSTVLCGVKDDELIRDATAAECFGIMPSDDYAGQFNFRKGGGELKEIISDGERAL